MKTKLVFSFGLLFVLSLMLSVTAASAALPANLSWIPAATNPVIPAGTCGAGSPLDPSVVFESANNYKIYFEDFGGGTDGGPGKIFQATTTDGGLHWTCAGTNPVLTMGASGAWDAVRVNGPTVIKDGGTYKMWYTGRNAAGVYAIGYATSPDGIVWTKSGAPVLAVGASGAWDSSMIREPSVVKVSSTYHMFYEGTDKWPYFKIGHATSSDGTTWTKDTANPVLSGTAGSWDQNEAYAPSVVMDGSTFEMFYSGNAGGAWVTGHASSPDGTVWTKDANAILSPNTTGWQAQDSTDYVGAVLDGSTYKLFYSAAGGGYQIGMATLTNQAQLTFDKLSVPVNAGQSVDVLVEVNSVTNLYGYQFEVNYDSTRMNVTAAFDNSFFDTSPGKAFVAWNAGCSAGKCQFAATKQNGLGIVASTGSGALAKLHITANSGVSGAFPLTFSNVILSQVGAVPILTDKTTGWVNIFGSATVAGVVQLQGRSTPLDAGTVTISDQYGYALPVTVNFSAADGTFSAPVSFFGSSPVFDVVAKHGLYLDNIKSPVTLSSGTVNLGTTILKGGDANNDGVIAIGDLTCIGSDFGTSTNSCVGGASDITHDGTTNILDLVLAGGNYGLTTPQPW